MAQQSHLENEDMFLTSKQDIWHQKHSNGGNMEITAVLHGHAQLTHLSASDTSRMQTLMVFSIMKTSTSY